ncbi:MAG: hypothetical protein K2X74_07965 [Acetobacteraceae bacterium]|nr:hypothetical protein [Acetobacteraceae bacterium]
MQNLDCAALRRAAGDHAKRLRQIVAELATLKDAHARVRRSALRSGVKLIVSAVLTATGLAATDVTAGWSLLAAVTSIGMLIDEFMKWHDDSLERDRTRRKIDAIEFEQAGIEAALTILADEIRRRC